MALNIDKTNQSTLTRIQPLTLAKDTNDNMPTAHTWTWTNENSWERGPTYRHEKRCFLRFDMNMLRVRV